MQSLQRVLAVVVVSAGLVFAILAAPGPGTEPLEQILDYTVDLQIEAAGTLLVTEQIAYDFATEERHGIFRDVPVRFRYDDRYDRVYPLEVLGVLDIGSQTPGEYTLEDVDDRLRIRIGDPDQTITGQHDYRIVYRVQGALNGFARPRRAVLERHRHRLGGTDPAGVGDGPGSGRHRPGGLLCRALLAHTRSCGIQPGRTVRPPLSPPPAWAPQEGLTVVMGFPTGVVPAPRPVLEERWSMTRAFSVTPGTLGMAGGILVVVLLVLGWLFGIVGREPPPGVSRRRRWAAP